MNLTEEVKKEIDNMSQIEMCRRWRFSPAGDPMFSPGGSADYFKKVWKEKGGMTPEISKLIEW